jgi:hypothetical protein
MPATAARLLAPLALAFGLPYAAQAAPVVSAQSISGAQVTGQGDNSSAYIVNGVAQPGYGAGPGGASSVGGTASSAWADTSQLDVNGLRSVQANARAEADPASGSLRVYAEAGVPNDFLAFSSLAFGQARWRDTITFNNTFAPTGNNHAGVWRTSLGASESGLIEATLILGTRLTAIDIDALLEVDCRSGATCDFGHTAKFGFAALANGLSWTSESGLVLTASGPLVDTVPEPASLWLVALRAAAAVGIRRRGREAARR